ncbi:hypothetical protein HanRHA438_Chr08g0340241 [Helianthus annuus]|nr:hypothetical protein HanHA89_Chr08g0288921 [Helianthus annuus]KAJ0896949.1 hypothetical protein HanRHA438_Chr08g0340241 [Helianthus annuus]
MNNLSFNPFPRPIFHHLLFLCETLIRQSHSHSSVGHDVYRVKQVRIFSVVDDVYREKRIGVA